MAVGKMIAQPPSVESCAVEAIVSRQTSIPRGKCDCLEGTWKAHKSREV